MHPLYKKISRRLVPFLMVLYLVAFLDRVNISFAALTMNRDLNIGEGLFGIAAGMFFLGYFIFEVPSNLLLLRFGARRWITVIMVLWGVLSVATAFVPGPAIYIVLRFLLGSAEAGFYPGVILYLTFWLPSSVRTSVMAIFVTAIPISAVIGSPVSAQILLLDHFAGLRGWQWLFLLEGSPAILLGALVLFFLSDRPDEVSWLTPEEKQIHRQEMSSVHPAGSKHHSFFGALAAEPVVYLWSLAYFLLMLGLYGLGFWIPKILVSHGVVLRNLGWAAALPYGVSVIAMVAWSRRSDRLGERRYHLFAAYVAAGVGFLIAAFAPNTPVVLTGFALAASGVLSAMPIFWSASTLRLAGPLAAAHIAVINSIGNLGGFVGPAAMGWLRQATHSYLAGLGATAICLLLGAFTTAYLCRPALPEIVPAPTTNPAS